jgi:hypothetical protein
MELHKDSLKVFKKATYLKPKPITRGFVAAVLRSAGKVDEKQLKTAWQNGWEKGHESAEQNKSFERERVVKELKSLKEGLAEFEKITGRSINQYTDFEGLAEQIQMAENYDELMSKYGILRHLRKNAKELIEKTNFLDDERKEATA